MSLRVVEDPGPDGLPLSRLQRENSTALVVLESEKHDELHTLQASQAALEFARAAGLQGVAISNQGPIYTVDSEGNALSLESGFPPGSKFRADYKVGSTLR